MNVQLPVHMDKAAFLDWVERREGRYELAGGRVVMMVGGTRAHGMIVRNLMALIGGQLDSRQWTLLADFGLDAGPKTLRYPDIVVDQAGGAIHDRVATAPALLVEVLSPSTETVDLGDKAAEYLRLPSLVSYVVFAQNEHKAWIWSRHDQASSGPRTIAGVDKIIHIAELRLQLPMAAVYLEVDANWGSEHSAQASKSGP